MKAQNYVKIIIMQINRIIVTSFKKSICSLIQIDSSLKYNKIDIYLNLKIQMTFRILLFQALNRRVKIILYHVKMEEIAILHRAFQDVYVKMDILESFVNYKAKNLSY